MHKKVLLFLGLFLTVLIQHPAAAQSYFQLKAQSAIDSIGYHYFLSIEADGNAVIRIAYQKEGKDYLAEIAMLDSIGANNSHYLVPRTAPRFIETDIDTDMWLPSILFESYMDSLGIYYAPASMTLMQTGKQSQVVPLLLNEQKTYNELVNDESLVLTFYKMDEPFYISLYSIVTRGTDPDELKLKIYLIIVANTNDSLIGKSSQKDMAGISELFQTLSLQAGIPLVQATVSGNAFSIRNTQRILDTIKPSANDIVVFYYSGHGFRYSNDISKYPRISFRTNKLQARAENNLAIEDISKKLLAKGARLTIVISDCCNEKIDVSVPVGLSILRMRGVGSAELKLNMNSFRKLFLPKQKTSIVIGSASPNQLAVGNPSLGGFYTHFFKAELMKSVYSNIGESSWLRISLNATENTRKQSLTALCTTTPNEDGRCVQRAEVRVLPPQ